MAGFCGLMAKHVLILVHGIGDGHAADSYAALIAALSKHYSGLYDVEFADCFDICQVNWDSSTDGGEQEIFEACFGDVRPSDRDLVAGWFPQHVKGLFDWRAWRYFSTFFVGD